MGPGPAVSLPLHPDAAWVLKQHQHQAVAFLSCCLTEDEIHRRPQEALGTVRLQQVAVAAAAQMTAVAPLPAVRLPFLWKPARQLKLIDALVAEGVGVSRGLAWGRLRGLQLSWM